LRQHAQAGRDTHLEGTHSGSRHRKPAPHDEQQRGHEERAVQQQHKGREARLDERPCESSSKHGHIKADGQLQLRRPLY